MVHCVAGLLSRSASPAPQGEQAVIPAPAYSPAAQSTQGVEAAESASTLPISQDEQVTVSPAEYVPAAQLSHSEAGSPSRSAKP